LELLSEVFLVDSGIRLYKVSLRQGETHTHKQSVLSLSLSDVSYYVSPNWPPTQNPASASRVLVLQMCTIMPGFYDVFWFMVLRIEVSALPLEPHPQSLLCVCFKSPPHCVFKEETKSSF
jgi:hypothetical protein